MSFVLVPEFCCIIMMHDHGSDSEFYAMLGSQWAAGLATVLYSSSCSRSLSTVAAFVSVSIIWVELDRTDRALFIGSQGPWTRDIFIPAYRINAPHYGSDSLAGILWHRYYMSFEDV